MPGYIFELDPNEFHNFFESFVFRYRLEECKEPIQIITKSLINERTPYAVSLDYCPSQRFEEEEQNNIGTWGSSDEEEEDKLSKYPCDYVFLLDRSGSMNGPKITLAKQALVIILKSLPEGSTFNIVSFGSEFEKMFEESIPVTYENIQKAIGLSKSFQADMGGTELLTPI